MAATSTMLPLGTPLPDFKLHDVVTNKLIKPENYKGKKALLLIFMCKHCPYVQHVKGEIAKIGKDYRERELGIIAISSNDPTAYPDDSPENLKDMAEEQEFAFPLCFDSTQNVAKALTAACTPDFFLFGRDRKLAYRGQLDDSRPSNGLPVSGHDLRMAIDKVLVGKAPDVNQKPSMGCSIKWKEGNSPSYQRG